MHLHLFLNQPNQRLTDVFRGTPLKAPCRKLEHNAKEDLLRALAESGTGNEDFLITDASDIPFVKDLSSQYQFLNIVIVISERVEDLAKHFVDRVNINFFIADQLFDLFARGSEILSKIVHKNSQATLEDYLGQQTMIHSFTIKATIDKLSVINEIEKIVVERTAHNFPAFGQAYAMKVGMVADELVLNAIYDANPRLRNAQRNLNLVLEDSEWVQIKIGVSDTLIGLSVKDPFGTLKRESLLKHINPEDVREKISLRKSGGFGLRLSLDASSQLVFLVQEGISTEVISLVGMEPSIREFKKKIKSLLYFTMRNQDVHSESA